MSTIRLSLTDDIQQFLDDLRKTRFHFLDNAEIIRAILSEYYAMEKKGEFDSWVQALPTEELSEKEQKSLSKALQSKNKEMTVDEVLAATEVNQCLE